jgi:hypothetical protein
MTLQIMRFVKRAVVVVDEEMMAISTPKEEGKD